MPIKLANNASGTLATAINASDTGIALTTGDGAEFPTLAASDYFYATITSTAGTQEIVKVTARSGDSLTVVRAQEGTTAAGFAAGARFELRVTAAAINDLVEKVRTDLAATSGSNLVGFLQSGTGAVATTVQAKLRETVSTSDFGIAGTGDETAKLQAFIDYLSSSRKLGILDKTVSFASNILFKSNVTLIGTGENFGGCLNPTGSAKILFDGVAAGTTYVQHCQIENILVYGNNSTAQNVIEIRNGYSNYFKNVRLHAVSANTNANKTGILIEGDADIRFDNLEVHGDSTYGTKYCVYITGGQVSFNQFDLEKSGTASLYLTGGHTTVIDPYLERFSGYGIYKGPSASLTVVGGEVVHSGGSGLGILCDGDNFTLTGSKYIDSTAGSFPYLVQVKNTDPTVANISRNVSIFGVPLSQVQYDANSYGPLAYNPSMTTDSAQTMTRKLYSRTITLADNTATTFFRVFQTGATTATLACRFRVWAQSSGFGKGFTEYVTLITRGGSNVAFTPLTQVFNNAQNSSANWSITLSGSATAVDANNIDFQATIDLTGTLNNGGTNAVYCTLEIEGPIAAWRVTQP